MRLIDADRLRKIFEDGECPCKLQYTLLGIVYVQPTAFDVDKVVEQLKQLKMKYFLTIANTGDADKDCAYKNIANTIDRAIEIIKSGGVE